MAEKVKNAEQKCQKLELEKEELNTKFSASSHSSCSECDRLQKELEDSRSKSLALLNQIKVSRFFSKNATFLVGGQKVAISRYSHGCDPLFHITQRGKLIGKFPNHLNRVCCYRCLRRKRRHKLKNWRLRAS